MPSLYERDQSALSKMSFLRFFPQAVIGGEGAYLIAEDGRRFLDFSASWGAASLGHAHPALRAAVDEAMASQAGASYLSSANQPAVELAERLLARMPERTAGRVWLGHSGSDANETVATNCVIQRRLSRRHAWLDGGVRPPRASGRSQASGLKPHPLSEQLS